LIRTVIIAPALASRAGLRAILSSDGEFEIAAEAARIEDLGGLASPVDVYLVQLDRSENLRIPDTWLDEVFPPAVLALTDVPEQAASLPSYPLRAWGVLPADCSEEELVTALYALEMGLTTAPTDVVEELLGKRGAAQANREDLAELTGRELEVLNLLASGYANKQISLELGISEHTVKFHVSSIYNKLDVSNRAEAVRVGILLGFVVI
jgi:NarL family two-component system response regulator YdfI